MEDVAGRSDRVGGVDQRDVRQLRRGHQADGEGFVARDLAVAARLDLRLGDAVVDRQRLGRFAEVVAGLERPRVGFEYRGVLGELLADPALRRLQRTLVQPVDQAQGEEVLAAVGLARAELDLGDRLAVEGVDGHADDAVTLERAVFQRVVLVTGLVQVGGAEGVAVDDQDAARL